MVLLKDRRSKRAAAAQVSDSAMEGQPPMPRARDSGEAWFADRTWCLSTSPNHEPLTFLMSDTPPPTLRSTLVFLQHPSRYYSLSTESSYLPSEHMAQASQLFGSCACERNQYTVTIPPACSWQASVFFDNSAANRTSPLSSNS